MIIQPHIDSDWGGTQCYDSLMLRRQAETVAGYVLAGGASRRMGRDKALLPVGGVPLVAHVAGILVEAAGSCAIVAPRGRYEGLGFPVLADGWPGEGPLGGIRTALESGEADWHVIAAVDLPRLRTEYLRELLAAARTAGRTAVPVHADGGLEPLCGVYRAGDLAELQRFFDAGGRRVKDFLREIPVHGVAADEESLSNVNTPAQWEAVQG
jgi:molybdopterin-guanine dinucleotide biosynthesis protein A